MQVAKGVYVLPLTNKEGTVYASLLTGDGHTVLVDTGYPGEFSQLEDALAVDGFAVSDLTDIVITHHDIDHIGCIKDLVEANPLISISASRTEAPYLEGRAEPEKVAKMRRDLESLSAEGEQFFKAFAQAFKDRFVVVDHALASRHVLPYMEDVQVVGTPGHTKGHIALYLKKEHILIVGDALRVVDDKIALPAKELANNYTGALDSVLRLSKYDADMVVCYHGGVYETEDLKDELTSLLEAAGVVFRKIRPEKPIVDVAFVATSPADGDEQVFGEGAFPESLNRMNYSAWFFDFIWSFIYALPLWGVLFTLIFVAGYLSRYLLGFTNMSPETISAVALGITVVFQLVRIAFGFHANKFAWRARAKKLENLLERAPYDKARARDLFRLRKKTVGKYKKSAENWAAVWGAFFVLNVVVTFFELAPTPADSFVALKAMFPAFLISPALIGVVWVYERMKRGKRDSHLQEQPDSNS